MKTRWTSRQKMIFYGCFIAYCGAYIGRLNASAALPGITAALGLTGEQSGMLQTVFALTYAAGQLVNGAIVDRISARRFVFIGLLGSALANLTFGLSSAYGVLLTAWCLNGVAQSMLWTPIVKLIAGWFQGEQRARISFRMSMTCVLGHLVAWAVSGYMAKAFTWRLSFLIPAGVLLVVCIVSALLLKDQTAQEATEKSESSAPIAQMPIHRLLFGSGLWMMLLCCVCNGFVRDGVMNWGPSILDEVGGTSISSVGVSLVIPVTNLAGIMLGRVVYSRASGNTRFAIGLMMLLGGGVALLLWGFGLMGLLLCALLLGVLCAIMNGANPLLTTLLPMDYDSVGRVGLVAGLVDGFIYLGSSMTGVVSGALHDAAGWKMVFLLWMAVSLAGTALGWFSGAIWKRKKG